ncbi:MAG: polysaccharide deacetylase family protein, partial [Lysinibacillus sp.]
MKRNHIFVLIICVLIISVSYAGFSKAADKGRRYYEESGQVVWDINTEEKVIALTFDDGPHPKYTAEILDLLTKYEAKGTFFIIGKNAEKYPELVSREYNEGHEIANHTYTHPFKTSVPNLEVEIQKTNEIIYGITGEYPELFRPVGGQYTDEMINAVADKGYKVVMWSWHQDTEDWKKPGANKIVKNVLKGTQP